MAAPRARAQHPLLGGEPRPSDAAVKVTRDLIRAGQLLKIELLDLVIVGLQTIVPCENWVIICGAR